MPELLPCPFCGSQANAKFVRHGLIAGNGFQGICCTVCSATVKERSQLKSIERWNARAKLAVENGNSLQQLKAEIAAITASLGVAIYCNDHVEIGWCYEALRELSAV